MNGDYSSLIWVSDKDGSEFVCTADFEHINEKDYGRLSAKERASCSNVNQIVGTEKG